MKRLSNEQKQLLFDYCLGLTSEKENAKVEELITLNEEAAEIHKKLTAALTPLQCIQPESCPDTLAEQTIRRLNKLADNYNSGRSEADKLTEKVNRDQRILRRTKMDNLMSLPLMSTNVIDNEETIEALEHPTRQIRPWVRYFARILDIFFFSVLVCFVLGMFAPSVLAIPNFLLGMAILFIWVFQESILLANCGTTPGKWLFKIKVLNSKGQKLTFSEALNRSFSVWLKGMGAGVPIISLITLLISRSKLKRDAVTAWDEEGGFVVTHGKIGAIRSVVIVVFLLGYFSVTAWESALEEQKDFGFAGNSVASQVLFAKPEKSIVTGKHGTYSIEFDPSTWLLQREVSNTDAEYEFHHDNGDAYAILIYERTPIPLNMLETAVIENLESVASDLKVLSRETIQLDYKPILSMQYEATIMTVPFVYHAYLSSGEEGTLQFITVASKYLFDEYQYDCQSLLRGLNLASYEPQKAE